MKYDFVAVLEYYGLYENLRLSRDDNIQIRCPFHRDRRPSLSVSLTRSVFNCFGCGASGTVVDFISRYEGINELEAHRKLVQIRKLNHNSIKSAERILLLDEKRLQDRMDVGIYPIPLWELVWVNRHIDDPIYYPFRRGILPHTLYEWCVGWDYLNHAVVFHIPYYGVYAGWQKRFVRENGNRKYVFSVGFRRIGLYWSGEFTERVALPLLIVEGPWDALYAYQAGYRNVGALLGYPSRTVLQSIGRYARNGDVVCAFDRDEAGKAYFELVKKYYPGARCVDYRLWRDAVDLDEVPASDLLNSILEVI